MSPADLSPYLRYILRFLYRLSELMNNREGFDPSKNNPEDPLQQEVDSLGQLVLQKIRDFVGPEIFLEKFQNVRDQVELLRRERKQKRKLQVRKKNPFFDSRVCLNVFFIF